MPTVVLVGVATPEIAHAHIATLLEFVEIGDEGVGLHDIGQVAAAAFNRDLGRVATRS
jgi:hypothetical protein